jgi:serine protease Do
MIKMKRFLILTTVICSAMVLSSVISAQETFQARIDIQAVYKASNGFEETRESTLEGEFSDKEVQVILDQDRDNPELLRKRVKVTKRTEQGRKEVASYQWDRSEAEKSKQSEGMQLWIDQDFGEGLMPGQMRSFRFAMPGGTEFSMDDFFPNFDSFDFADFSQLKIPGAFADKAYIGIFMEEMHGGQGVLIQDVAPESPAEKAGLKAGDIILAINDVEVKSTAELTDLVQRLQKGEKAMIRLYRGAQEMTLIVEPEFRGLSNMDRLLNEGRFAQPYGNFTFPSDSTPEKKKWKLFPNKSDDQKYRLGVTVESMVNYEGLKVMEVVPGSIADRNGIQKFDIIERFDGKKVNQPKDLQSLVADKQGEEVKLRIRRNGKKKNIKVLLQ